MSLFTPLHKKNLCVLCFYKIICKYFNKLIVYDIFCAGSAASCVVMLFMPSGHLTRSLIHQSNIHTWEQYDENNVIMYSNISNIFCILCTLLWILRGMMMWWGEGEDWPNKENIALVIRFARGNLREENHKSPSEILKWS